MLKIFILLVIATNFIFAGNLKVGDKLNNFSLTDQFDGIHTITNNIETMFDNLTKHYQMIFYHQRARYFWKSIMQFL